MQKWGKKFIGNATEWIARYQSNEYLASKIYLLQVPHVNNLGKFLKEDFDEKINIIIEILSERKKDIIEKRRDIVTWSSIILSLIFGITGIFLSRCSTTKFDETQFNDIKQSIEQVKPLKPTDIRITNDTINITTTKTLKVNITNNKARTKSNNQSK